MLYARYNDNIIVTEYECNCLSPQNCLSKEKTVSDAPDEGCTSATLAQESYHTVKFSSSRQLS